MQGGWPTSRRRRNAWNGKDLPGGRRQVMLGRSYRRRNLMDRRSRATLTGEVMVWTGAANSMSAWRPFSWSGNFEIAKSSLQDRASLARSRAQQRSKMFGAHILAAALANRHQATTESNPGSAHVVRGHLPHVPCPDGAYRTDSAVQNQSCERGHALMKCGGSYA